MGFWPHQRFSSILIYIQQFSSLFFSGPLSCGLLIGLPKGLIPRDFPFHIYSIFLTLFLRNMWSSHLKRLLFITAINCCLVFCFFIGCWLSLLLFCITLLNQGLFGFNFVQKTFASWFLKYSPSCIYSSSKDANVFEISILKSLKSRRAFTFFKKHLLF